MFSCQGLWRVSSNCFYRGYSHVCRQSRRLDTVLSSIHLEHRFLRDLKMVLTSDIKSETSYTEFTQIDPMSRSGLAK